MAMSDQRPNLIDTTTLNDPNKLRASLEPLRSLGFPIDTWTPDVLAQHYLLPNNFIKMVRIVTSIQDEVVRSDVLSFGVTKSLWSQNSLCDPISMYKFCRWLRTPEGTTTLINAQKKTKLRKRARPGQELSTVALVLILTQQLLDFAKEKKKGPEIKLDFKPASDYIPLDKNEMEKRCFNKYEEECCVKQVKAAPCELVLPFLLDKYSNVIREAHMYEFCSCVENKGLLRRYAEKKIAYAKQVGELRVASTFGFYLTESGEEIAPQSRASKACRSDPLSSQEIINQSS